MGIFANVAQQNTAQPSQSGGGGLFSRVAQRQQGTEQPDKKNNMLQGLFVNTIGRPAVRASEAIGGMVAERFGNEDQKKNYYEAIKKPTELPLGLGTVAPQKAFGEGGGKQLGLETAKSAFDIATLGEGGAVNAGLRGVGEKIVAKTLPNLAKTKVGGFVAKQIPKVAANLTEGEAYNTGTNLLNGRPAFDNAGAVGALSVGLPPLISGAGKLLPKLVPKSENILNRVNRLNPSDAQKFEQIAGESHGSYLERTKNFGAPEKTIENESKKFVQSLKEVDDAIADIPGTYKSSPVDNALNDLNAREARIDIPNEETKRITYLTNKNKAQGLSMKEVNEVKRLYEKNVKLGYNKLTNPDGVARATRVDNALREWQFKEAEKAGLMNLRDLNKQTQISKFLVDKLGKQLVGKSGNEAVNLTDWIILAGGDPNAVAAYLTKKVFSSKNLQAQIADLLSKKEGVGAIKAKFGGKTGLPALIPDRDYSTAIEMGAPRPKSTIEAPAQRIFNQSRIDSQLKLPAGRPGAMSGQILRLPKSVREQNLGLDEITGAKRPQRRLPKIGSRKPFARSIPPKK